MCEFKPYQIDMISPRNTISTNSPLGIHGIMHKDDSGSFVDNRDQQ